MDKSYIGCPRCGRVIARSSDVAMTETCCPKCRAKISYIVHGAKVLVELVAGAETARDEKLAKI